MEKKRLQFLADLWSQSEFRTERNAERKTNPQSEITQCVCCIGIFEAGRPQTMKPFLVPEMTFKGYSRSSILVFPYKTSWEYSNGDPLNDGVK